MRGCEGNPQGLSLNGPGLALGDDGLPMGDQEKCLRHCLTLRTRRWAMFEFMTPKIDEPWYHQGSMRQLLDSMGLQGLRNMTRADMRFLRLALGGRPRRLSPAFLHGERCSLVQHREKCREFYGQLAHDPTLPYPPDVPEQIAVGQSVTARHPRLRTLHDGDVLTASVSTYMVQFHRAELSVAKVADIDVGDACDGALAPVTAASAAAAAQAGMPGGADGGSTGRSDIVRSLVDTSWLLSCCRFLAQAFQVSQSHCIVQTTRVVRRMPCTCDHFAFCTCTRGIRRRPQHHSSWVQFSGGIASLDAVDAVARLAQQKAQALSELRAMTAEAEQRRAMGETGDFEEEFQNRFAQKVLEVCGVAVPAGWCQCSL